MAKSFDTNFRELVLAVALCNVENVKRILSSEWFEKNTIKIMGKGRKDVGFIDVPLSIHNIAQCWETILNVDTMNEEFLASFNGDIERLHENNKTILELLRHKFTGSSDKIVFRNYAECIPYGVLDAEDYEYEREELKEFNLRQIDEELILALSTFDLDKFEELIRYGANPWANLGDTDCVWERIVLRNTCMIHDLLHDVLSPKNRRDLPELLGLIISVAGYESFDRLLEGYVSADSDIKETPIKTIPRIIYSSEPFMNILENVVIEITYDPDTDETEFKNLNRWQSEVETTVPEKAIKSLLTPESIEQFMNLELLPPEVFVLDGGSYTLKMVDSDGNFREIECDDAEMKQVPQMVFLEKYAKAIRKNSKIGEL